MANNFKNGIDRLMWDQITPLPNAHAAGVSVACDLRNNFTRNPFIYQLASNVVLNRYSMVTKSTQASVAVPTLGGTFGAGAECVFAPSQGLKGSIGVGSTVSRIVIGTAFPTAVGVNMLANRGGGAEYGFILRVINRTTGRVEERIITDNTGGTTPTIAVNQPFTNAPANTDFYEILAGRLFMLGAGTLAASTFRSYEVGSNTLANGGTTNLPASITVDSAMAALDEQYVPFDCFPGEGMIKGNTTYNTITGVLNGADYVLKCLSATAAAAGTITGAATLDDSAVVANEFRNFQIRIVQDLVTPAAVGQRAIIASHTAGPSAVYTLGANWTTTPSASAKFVIELPNLIILRSSGVTTTFTYNYNDTAYNNGTTNLATNTWSTTLFGVGPAANGAGGMIAPSWGIRPDVNKNSRNSHLFFFRGGASTTLDLLDIANGVNGTWSSSLVYDGASVGFTTGSCGAYAPFDDTGRMYYMNGYVASAINQMYRFDVQNRVLVPHTATDTIQTAAALVGSRIACYVAIDGGVAPATDLYNVVFMQTLGGTIALELLDLT
jgi:hypothetical protein